MHDPPHARSACCRDNVAGAQHVNAPMLSEGRRVRHHGRRVDNHVDPLQQALPRTPLGDVADRGTPEVAGRRLDEVDPARLDTALGEAPTHGLPDKARGARYEHRLRLVHSRGP